MCFSERVSWTTLVVSLVGCATLASYGIPYLTVLAGFFGVVACMQLWEALLWRSKRCDASNARISDLGAINNHLEPIALWILSDALLKPRASRTVMAMVYTAVVVYAAVFGFMTRRFMRRPIEERCTRPGPNGGGLIWKWNDFGRMDGLYVYFLATMLTIVYAYMPRSVANGIAALFVGSFAVSYGVYRKSSTVGAMWCWFAAFMPWLFVFLQH